MDHTFVMWLSIITTLIAVASLAWGIIGHFNTRRYNEVVRQKKEEKESFDKAIMSALAKGAAMVDVVDSKVDSHEKYNTQKFLAIEEDLYTQSKDINLLKAQHMTEQRVDSKLKPIKDEVDETKIAIRDLRDEFRSHASVNELNVQQLLSGMSEIKGYLKAKSEVSGDGR